MGSDVVEWEEAGVAGGEWLAGYCIGNDFRVFDWSFDTVNV